MPPSSSESVVESLLTKEQLTLALGKLFAESFAVYTVEVLCRLNGVAKTQQLGVELPAGAPAVDSPGPLPDYVKTAYASLSKAGTHYLAASKAASNVARNKLVIALRDKGWTQAELARRMKKSPTVISRAFRNPERRQVKTLRQIATALGVDISDLL